MGAGAGDGESAGFCEVGVGVPAESGAGAYFEGSGAFPKYWIELQAAMGEIDGGGGVGGA